MRLARLSSLAHKGEVDCIGALNTLKMECFQYLENQLTRPPDTWSLELPTDLPHTLEFARGLWNFGIKFSQAVRDSTSSVTLLKVADLRRRACELLQIHSEAGEGAKFWGRAGKSYLDSGATDQALDCLKAAEDLMQGLMGIDKDSQELQFNLKIWTAEVYLKQRNPGLFEVLKDCSELVQALPFEKFRLARMILVDIADFKYKTGEFSAAAKFLELCLIVAENPPKHHESLIDLQLKAKQMLAACWLELGNAQKAKLLHDDLVQDVTSITLGLKIAVLQNDYYKTQEAVEKLVAEGASIAELMTAIDILLGANKLVEACKALMTVASRLDVEEVLFRWFQILFSLNVINGSMDDSLPYLDIFHVLNRIKKCVATRLPELKKLLWEYAVELHFTTEYSSSNLVLESHYFAYADSLERIQAAVLIAQNHLALGDSTKALGALNTVPASSISNMLKCQVLLDQGNLTTDRFSELLLEIKERDHLLSLSNEFVKRQRSELSAILSKQIVKHCNGLDNLGELLCIVAQAESEPETLTEIGFRALREVTDVKVLNWLHRWIWNCGIKAPSSVYASYLMYVSAELALKAENEDEAVQAYEAAASYFFEDPSAAHKVSMPSILAKLEELGSSEIDCFKFQQGLASAPHTLPDFIETTEYSADTYLELASLAHKAQHKDLTSMCLKRAVQLKASMPIATLSLAYRELVSLAHSSEEAYFYAEAALKLSEQKPDWPKVELSWLLATSWNFGIKYYKQFSLNTAERWLSLALRAAERTSDVSCDQMRQVYSDVLKMRYRDKQ